MIVRSPILAAVRHGFSTRQGGVSTGRYESLNLSSKWGDDPSHVEENRRRFAAEGGFHPARLFTVRQVHGANVVRIRPGMTPSDVAALEADALVTDVEGVALAIGTADCVPILIGDGLGRVAAVHAGWRGTLANIVGAAVHALVELGAQVDHLRAALGPCICRRCFEVGPEVAERFLPLRGSVDLSGAKPHVDLRLANVVLLARSGVRTVDAAVPCTMCERERFFSYRRDGAQIGQQLSFVAADTSS